MRRLLAVLAMLAAVLVAVPGPASSRTIGEEWGLRADTAIAQAIAADVGTGSAFQYSWLAQGIASRHGWDDPRAVLYLGKALAQRHPDGGFGLPYAWDAFGDGTVNPASVTYTVTLFQVGEVVLDAHKHGRAELSVLTGILDKLYTIPHLPVTAGYGLAYSDHPNDARAGYVVHNVNAAAALLLADVAAAGIGYRAADSRWVRQAIVRQEVLTYRPVTRDWLYRDGSPTANDSSHNALGIQMALTLAAGIGTDALDWAMTRTLDSRSGWTHAGLARYDCAHSARWLGEYDAKMAQPASRTFNIWSQISVSTSAAAAAC